MPMSERDSEPGLLPPPEDAVEKVLRAALEEDLGPGGDVTTSALVPAALRARATIVAEESLVLAGIEFAFRVMQHLDPDVRRLRGVRDGVEIAAGTAVLEVEGLARGLLTAERTALNILGRLCGVATATRRVSSQLEGTGSRIFDTRKTTPGLRLLEKYAVRCGGGVNHRLGLHDMALIKENHIALAGGVGAAVRQVRANVSPEIKVQVEVSDLEGLDAAVEAGADMILLDNVDALLVEQAVRQVGGQVELEASGGLSEEDAVRLARRTGVARISMGALTRSSVWSDLSMDVNPLPAAR